MAGQSWFENCLVGFRELHIWESFTKLFTSKLFVWDRLFVHCVLEIAEVGAFIGTDDQRADFMEKLDSLKR